MEAQTRRRRRRGEAPPPPPQRPVDYCKLRNPFTPQPTFSEDRIAAIHETALRVLEELGMKVLLPEARALYRAAGARVEDEMVYIGREIVAAAVASAPRSFELKGGAPHRDLTMELGTLAFQSGAGCPNVNDRVRGRRPGTTESMQELTKLVQHFDAIQMLSPGVEPQDAPPEVRHYALSRAQLTLSDKIPFVFSRGTGQAEDCFEMIRDFRGLSDAEFAATPYCYTIINTNSPRQIDIPMAQGLIDFARAGQPSIVTPFTLMGAMAPITPAGAMTLSHAEALAAITLTQLARPGAPVLYGSFTSNVDMKSGAPAFGTPEQVKAGLGIGQLARFLGLPWRNAAGSAANCVDAQAAHETEISAWGAILSGATVIIHAAGWLEGGLTFSYEKFITDMDMVQVFAELCTAPEAGEDEIGFEALREVQPGGHFFGCGHTMARYATEFYQPLSWDWSNFGTWSERGGVETGARATGLWQAALDAHETPPNVTGDRIGALDDFIARRSAEGGAPPVS